MRKIVVIPARIKSTRLPNKLLLPYKDKPIIQHVIENAVGSKADYVFLASSDDEILSLPHQKKYGANFFTIRTKESNNGTQRMVRAMREVGLRDDDIVINLQGDLPLLKSEYIDELFDLLLEKDDSIVTLARQTVDIANPSVVKVVLDSANHAMYFSRSVIPYGAETCLEHIGIYGFKKRFFDTYHNIMHIQLGSEDLEQLAWMHHGHKILVSVVTYSGFSIDTQADYDRLLTI